MSDLVEFIAKLGWLLQLALLIHVFKTGRPYWWAWILFMAPVLGGLVYLFVEVLPDTRSSRGDAGGWLARLKPRAWRIKAAEQALEETDTVKVRLALASELLGAGRTQEAHDVATEALRGVFKDDPHTLTEVARYKVELARWDEALALLENVNTRADRMLALIVALLKGRALHGAGRLAEAESCLHEIEGRYLGEEPSYFLAAVLDASGQRSEAVTRWKAIKTRYRKATPSWRRSERRWYRLSVERLKAAEQTST